MLAVDHYHTNSIEWLTVGQAAKLLGVSAATIRRWEKLGEIVAQRTAKGHRRFYRQDILDYQRKWKPQFVTTPECFQHHRAQSVAHASQALELRASPPQELLALKTQLKVVAVLIFNLKGQEAMIMVIEWLIQWLIGIVGLLEATTPLQVTCSQLQIEFRSITVHIHEEQRQQRIQEVEDQQKIETGKRKLPGRSSQERPSKRMKAKHKLSNWEKSRKNAKSVFWKLVEASSDTKLDTKERQRAKSLCKQITDPYQRMAAYLAHFKPRELKHDIPLLLLSSRPQDFGIPTRHWSVRSLAKACSQLGTESASKSQIGRFLHKELKWKRKLKRRLLSPDPQFGAKLKKLGLLISQLGKNDRLLYGDEFKYTSSKVAEHLQEGGAPLGLQVRLPHQDFRGRYAPVCSLQLSGLYDPCTRELEVLELFNNNYAGYLPTLVALICSFLEKTDKEGRLLVVLDNGSIHKPALLVKDIGILFGDRIQLFFLPTYSPNLNPIERVWEVLLAASLRDCDSEQDLKASLSDALIAQRQQSMEKEEAALTLHCPLCKNVWIFRSSHIDVPRSEAEQNELETDLEKHLCFNIPDLNPYTVHVLTHSQEDFIMGH